MTNRRLTIDSPKVNMLVLHVHGPTIDLGHLVIIYLTVPMPKKKTLLISDWIKCQSWTAARARRHRTVTSLATQGNVL